MINAISKISVNTFCNSNVFASMLFLSLCFCVYKYQLVFNITSSMPRGFYVKSLGTIQRDDIITFCLDAKQQQEGLKKGYLLAGTACGKTAPLIKQVVAIPNDDIVLTANTITVNHKIYHAPIFYKDSQGRPLNSYPIGRYDKTTGYWVVGTNDQRSWDSRYYGPLKSSQILHKMRLLLAI